MTFDTSSDSFSELTNHHITTYQVEAEIVEDLPGVVRPQDLTEEVLGDGEERLWGLLEGVTAEVIEGQTPCSVPHQTPLRPWLGKGAAQDSGCW